MSWNLDSLERAYAKRAEEPGDHDARIIMSLVTEMRESRIAYDLRLAELLLLHIKQNETISMLRTIGFRWNGVIWYCADCNREAVSVDAISHDPDCGLAAALV